MTSRAVVVGCDAYPKVPNGNLRGAVADALAMHAWLLDVQGGGLGAADVVLLASPAEGGAAVPDGAASGPADVEHLLQALADLAEAPAGADDRLFVYFAGHGAQTDPWNRSLSEDALVLHDFSTLNPAAGCIGVGALERRLRGTAFGEFFVIADACRDFPFDKAFQLGSAGFDDAQVREVRPYQPRAFIAQAAVPGGVATGSRHDGQIRGDFTRVLLDGLAGGGSAKSFNPEVPRYEVTWDHLRGWLETQLPGRVVASAEGNPALATFEDGWFAEIELTVDLRSDGALDPASAPLVRLEYDRIDPDLGSITLTPPFPQARRVPPRRQRISGRLPDRPWAQVVVDAYVDMPVTLTLPRHEKVAPILAAEQTLGDVDGGAIGDIDEVGAVGDIAGAERVTRSGGSRPGLVMVTASDPAVVIELCDLAGTVILTGVGRLAELTAPGSYVARVLVPGRPPLERAIELTSSGTSVELVSVDQWGSRWSPSPVIDVSLPPSVLTGDDGLATLSLQVERAAAGPTDERTGTSPWRIEGVPRERQTQVVDGAVTVLVCAVPPGTRLLGPGVALEVPLAPGVHTAVIFASDGPVAVRLFDQDLLGTPAAHALDRAQAYAEDRALSASRLLLDDPELAGSDVAAVLRGDPASSERRTALAGLLAADQPPSTVLSGQLWAVRRSIVES